MNYPNRIKGWFRLSYQLIITRFKIFNLSSRTVRDKALLTLTTTQKKKIACYKRTLGFTVSF